MGLVWPVLFCRVTWPVLFCRVTWPVLFSVACMASGVLWGDMASVV